jgi:hypothetical protein
MCGARSALCNCARQGRSSVGRPAVLIPGPSEGGVSLWAFEKIPVGQVRAEVREEKYAASDTNRKYRDLQLFLG